MDTPYLMIWRETVKNYLQKGKFTKIPKKDTPEYQKLVSKYHNALTKKNVMHTPKIATGSASQ